MSWFILVIFIPAILGSIFMNWTMRKIKMEHIQKIEQLKKIVVDLAEKQLMLREKEELVNRFKINCYGNFEKLNDEISGLLDLMMKTIETKEHQKGKT